jgi:hypothetical protein
LNLPASSISPSTTKRKWPHEEPTPPRKQQSKKRKAPAPAATATVTATAGKSKRFFFDAAADVTVFEEILCEDGLFVSDGCTMNERWQRVHGAGQLLGIRSSQPTLKARVNRCVEKYNAAQADSKKKSGMKSNVVHIVLALTMISLRRR